MHKAWRGVDLHLSRHISETTWLIPMKFCVQYLADIGTKTVRRIGDGVARAHLQHPSPYLRNRYTHSPEILHADKDTKPNCLANIDAYAMMHVRT